MNKTKVKISAAELDRRFDAGEDLDEFVDWENAKVIEPETCQVEISVPSNLIEALDREARRKKLNRKKLIEQWVTGHLKAV